MEEYYPVRCENCGYKMWMKWERGEESEQEKWHFYAHFDLWLPVAPENLDEIDDCPSCTAQELEIEDTIPGHVDDPLEEILDRADQLTQAIKEEERAIERLSQIAKKIKDKPEEGE